MDLRELRYFVVLAEELHFRRAAERLHVAQPSLSQAIRRLEDELRVPLFVRDRRHVELAPAGHALLERARAVLAAAAEIPAVARSAASAAGGGLVLGYVDYARASVMPALVAAFRRGRPDADVSTRAAASSPEALRSVTSGRADAAILRLPVEGVPPLQSVPLLHEPFVLALPAAHRLASRDAVALGEVADEPFALFHRDLNPAAHDLVLAAFERAAGRPPVLAQGNSRMDDSLMFVAGGAGLGLFPASVAASAIPGVSFHEIEPPAPTLEVALVWDAANPNPLLPVLRRAAGSARRTLGAPGPPGYVGESS